MEQFFFQWNKLNWNQTNSQHIKEAWTKLTNEPLNENTVKPSCSTNNWSKTFVIQRLFRYEQLFLLYFFRYLHICVIFCGESTIRVYPKLYSLSEFKRSQLHGTNCTQFFFEKHRIILSLRHSRFPKRHFCDFVLKFCDFIAIAIEIHSYAKPLSIVR